jgi:methyl-accepting chemotaxis protein
MEKRQKSRNVRGKPASMRASMRIECVQNDQRQLPAEVAALFDDLLLRSVQATHAEQELRTKMDEANVKFRQEQARLADSLAQQLGVSATVKELAALGGRHVRTVIDTMERAHSAVSAKRTRAGKGAKKTRTR